VDGSRAGDVGGGGLDLGLAPDDLVALTRATTADIARA